MAGVFYLPRLYVYHSGVDKGEKTYSLFCTMEEKLLKIIMNPAMVLTFVTGVALARLKYGGQAGNHWLTVKGFFVVLLAFFHHYLAKIRLTFLKQENKKNHKFYRVINEIPTILLLIIVAMVVFKPF